MASRVDDGLADGLGRARTSRCEYWSFLQGNFQPFDETAKLRANCSRDGCSAIGQDVDGRRVVLVSA